MLEIQNLTKKFANVKAVDDLSFDVPTGQIVGLIGQNGAGKTTTFHSILNFLHYEGEILWDKQPLTEEQLDQVGYLPEERSLLPKMMVEEHILYLAKLKGKTAQEIKPLINDWLEKFQVKGQKSDKIKDLSKGNQQKVQLICTLIHQPRLIILDEPFSGLDPVNADLLKNAILEMKDQGAAIIFSSHDMTNVTAVCDRLVMLRDGRAVLNGTLDEVREQFGRTELYVTTERPLADLQALPHVQSVQALSQAQRYLLHLDDPAGGPEIFERLTNGQYIREFSQQPPTLDMIFRMKAGEGHA
ncbi:sodium ABC transporter ATP-binding protein [Ligilactobacillus salitolerans]|uniref:Sodium ABC transporter ATP-binding protein n=1 Tax=Ligilactobacillus salitolerans TaxID=1808352 RepID=A0A401IPW5_9LACO|nr:ABC transporter ATP-binding protein [Ligilactobacillus salitolerans]GBG93572.1 sodium ABC transporter ATP-binding protein [Ligilactobacillus salitolerans]